MKFAAIVIAASMALPLFAETPLYQQGREAYDRQDYSCATRLLEQAVQQDPNNADAHAVLGASYGYMALHANIFRRASLATKTRDEFEKAVKLDPNQRTARIGLLEYYTLAPRFLGGSIDKAREEAAFIRMKDELGGHRAYAFIDTHLKQTDLARKEMLDAVAEQPQSAKAHYYLGSFYSETEENYTAALTEFEIAVKLDPNYMPARFELGHIAAITGIEVQRGQQALASYLNYKPKSDEPTLDSANRWLQQLEGRQGMAAYGAGAHK
jgi:tetratricopeptide (TPR) repeat protein